ncbi:odorant receptor 59b [Drosophila busckii]|uniref:odorant receptor 59b n=1 Tax=Drosophila busckii TaxID=30019 RepID=UPI00083EE482|nr:odorant receptor 59b [Drosophila busckii]
MEKVFKLIKPKPLTEKVQSRDATIYMYRVMKIIGWIPPRKGPMRYLYRLWTCIPFFFGAIYLPIMFGLSYFIEFKDFSPGEFLTSLQVAINVYGTAIKCTILYVQLWRLEETENVLDQLDKRRQSEADRQRIHAMVAKCNYVFLIFAIVYGTYVTSTFLSAVFMGRPPYKVYNPYFKYSDGKGFLWAQSVFEFAIMLFAVYQDELSDTYMLVYMIIFRAHLDILRHHIENLRLDPSKNGNEHYEDLVNCIVEHKMIIDCCNWIRPIMQKTIFVQFLLIGIVLGLTLINIFFFSDLFSGISSSFFLLAVLMETFPFCYCCNLLIDDCDNLSEALFQSKWVNAEPRYKSTLIHFMHNLQKPIAFIAGGIIPITLNSNISVAKFAFSIITIVREMNLAEKFK